MNLSCVETSQFCTNGRGVCNMCTHRQIALPLDAFAFTLPQWPLKLNVNLIENNMIKMVKKLRRWVYFNAFWEIVWVRVDRNLEYNRNL